MEKLLFPLIVLDEKYTLYLFEKKDCNRISRLSAYAVLFKKVFNTTKTFDANGNQWKFDITARNYPDTFLNKLLARTFYNPKIEVTVTWLLQGTYHFDELKQAIIKCIEKDDDILTQFEPANSIIEGVLNTNSFNELISVLNNCIFKVANT